MVVNGALLLARLVCYEVRYTHWTSSVRPVSGSAKKVLVRGDNRSLFLNNSILLLLFFLLFLIILGGKCLRGGQKSFFFLGGAPSPAPPVVESQCLTCCAT